MKVLLLIDSLNSGGAQRQIVTLATGLKKRKYQVAVLTYSPGNHFQQELDQQGIPYVNVHHPSFLKTLVAAFREILKQRPQVICAYLYRPNLIALISRLFLWRTKVFVSERSFEDPAADWSRGASRFFYPLAKKIIVNSRSQTNLLQKKMWWLSSKMQYIGNGVDPDLFSQAPPSASSGTLNLLSIGHVNALKNTKALIRAAAILRYRHTIPVTVSWVGRNYDIYGKVNPYYNECLELLREQKMDAYWKWEGKRQDIQTLYHASDLVVHASLGEGFPNVICEAFMCARPVAASNICDHPYIVKEGVNGFLFVPQNYEELAEKIRTFYLLPAGKKEEMRQRCRETALKEFNIDRMIDSYVHTFQE